MKRSLSFAYLLLCPLWAFVLAMTVGHISYRIYIPVWLMNVVIMIMAAWVLGLHVINSLDGRKKQVVVAAFLLVVPTMFISMFFGLGPPPETPALWVATATEQQVRFIILIISGIFFVLGFAVMRESLKDTPGSLYGVVGFTAVMVAIPLFIFNMIFWGAYLPQLFKMMTSAGMDKTPEWFKPLASQFNLLTPVETAIRYLGIAAFAGAIYKAGWFNKKSSFIYIAICLVEFAITVFPNAARLLPVPFFIVTIPANPFIVAFYIGINLLRKFGGETK